MSPFFPASSVAFLAGVSERALPFTAAIQHFGTSKAPGGTHVETWVTDRTVACRLAMPEPDETIIAAAPTGRARWILILPRGTPIAAGNRVIVTGEDVAGTSFTKTVSVLGVEAPLAAEAMRRALVEEVPVT